MSQFSSDLLRWHQGIDRNLPWKSTRDPYKIWLSEIILQQTRVDQGTPYYHKFIDKYPTVLALAAAHEDEVLKTWEGLGYYSRARNLHHTARLIVEQYGGVFPDQYDQILDLKGVGKYTAAAIGSFAFGLPYPVIDGNVKRVISRYFGITEPIDTTEGNRRIESLTDQVFSKEKPSSFNQAIMDFGAMVCTPKNPQCCDCPFSSTCMANLKDLTNTIPFKSKKITKKNRVLPYILIEDEEGRILVNKREKGDIWAGLYEFLLLEKVPKAQEIGTMISERGITIGSFRVINKSKSIKHILTHQILDIKILHIKCKDVIFSNANHLLIENIENVGFPKPLKSYLAHL